MCVCVPTSVSFFVDFLLYIMQTENNIANSNVLLLFIFCLFFFRSVTYTEIWMIAIRFSRWIGIYSCRRRRCCHYLAYYLSVFCVCTNYYYIAYIPLYAFENKSFATNHFLSICIYNFSECNICVFACVRWYLRERKKKVATVSHIS